VHAQPKPEGGLFDWRSSHLVPAALGTIRLRQHGRHFVPGLNDSFKRGNRELWRAQENDAHSIPPVNIGERSLESMTLGFCAAGAVPRG
jgi:hypothetical protein